MKLLEIDVTKFLLGLFMVPLMATAGIAGAGTQLTDKQMDKVIAGCLTGAGIGGCGVAVAPPATAFFDQSVGFDRPINVSCVVCADPAVTIPGIATLISSLRF
jgi:hypothetical protein